MSPMNGILIIAHSPLAQALLDCVLHVFPDSAQGVRALDVPAKEAPEETLLRARQLANDWDVEAILILSDVFGATPCNVAQQLNDGEGSPLA